MHENDFMLNKIEHTKLVLKDFSKEVGALPRNYFLVEQVIVW